MNRSVLALMVAAALSAPSGSPASAAAAPPALAANVEITGGPVTQTTVRLAKPITAAALTATAGLSGSGTATITTVVLVKASGAPATFVFQRTKYGDQDIWRAYTLGDPQAKEVLPAGTYKLYVLSDAPTTVKLKLGNQPGGTAKIRATTAAKGRSAAIAVPPVGAVQPMVNESHDTYTATRPFLVFGVVAFNLTTKHSLTVQSCTYDGDPPTTTTANCNGGTLGPDDSSPGSTVPITKPTDDQRVRWMRSEAGKKLTYGLAYHTTSVPSAVYRWNVWLEL